MVHFRMFCYKVNDKNFNIIPVDSRYLGTDFSNFDINEEISLMVKNITKSEHLDVDNIVYKYNNDTNCVYIWDKKKMNDSDYNTGIIYHIDIEEIDVYDNGVIEYGEQYLFPIGDDRYCITDSWDLSSNHGFYISKSLEDGFRYINRFSCK